ncbi:hypothetical protein [Flagellimonas flava]|uniref:Uncharacterized protein n=1 Tax=Flagellimonas flava TaxID=570519 RepID=A0A1M5HJW5_9FLAO|nr:hypothetical protein [Allomuricauda flava]SHG16263.1 hypothetical protein SAMN04488116_0023 [Allomuricauda flava]
MGEFFKAELKDRFLEYATDRRDYFEIQVLYDEFLRPNYDLGFVEKLIREIRDYDTNLLDVMGGNGAEIFMLASTRNTQDFLDDGGFMDMHVKEEEKWDTFLGQLANNRKLSKDEKQLLKRSTPGPKRERTLLVLLISAIVFSFLFTLFSILKGAFWEPDYVPVDEFERKLEQIQERYNRENQRLGNQLEQARITIDSLKGDAQD